ncbi:MAG TPA: cell division protein ZapA [Xanthobacteraceae bacterium]|nr:cell division protein ZapA [Xanthobacteraceae bacterium]
MSQISVTINGRVYRMACDDGQEEHLSRLARDLDARIARLRESFGEIGDTRLTVMAGLMVADELVEAKRQIKAREQEIAEMKESRLAIGDRIEASELAVAEAIGEVAERIEQLAHSLNGRPGPTVALG